MLDALFLDAGGVLVHPDWDHVASVLSAHGVAVSPAALREADPRARKELDVEERIHGTNDGARTRQYFELVLAGASVASSAGTRAAFAELADHHARRNLWRWVPPEVVPALERLTAAGLPLLVVSNANGTLHAQFERLGLARYFGHLLDSTREQVEKPDPRLFERALARAGARPERTIHVGDLYHVDVAGARAAGIEGWLLDPGGLYEGYDCPRVPSLGALAERVLEAP